MPCQFLCAGYNCIACATIQDMTPPTQEAELTEEVAHDESTEEFPPPGPPVGNNYHHVVEAVAAQIA